MQFDTATAIYDSRGFQQRIGCGARPALLHIDLANAWTRPGSAFTCAGMDDVINGVQALNAAACKSGVPLFYTTTAYDNPVGPYSDAGLWQYKIPVEELQVGSPAVEIDERLALADDDHLITKKRASAFHGTHLSGMLCAAGVDTVIITGVTAAGCVRHTAEDAISDGFRPIVVRECVSDRIPDAVQWNLFDIDAKFGDVLSLEQVLVILSQTSSTSGADAERPSE